ncbi:FAD binding domain protein [Aureobasidium subglaciale]|nr:FAD binding domain protein [Aureobasidium subglaciale]
MIAILASLALYIVVCGTNSVQTLEDSAACRCFPGDVCWPSTVEWNTFNHTIGGKLLTTKPLASVCHDSEYGPFNLAACDHLRSNWFAAETHLGSVSSIMAAFFTNNSCNLFSPQDAPCTLGGLVSFSVDASGVEDFRRTIAFVRRHNIRLVIRNTGHDYNGKSTGAGALAIWTHHMKHKEILDYKSPSYTGKAMKMGAGIEVYESYEFAQKHGLVSVGGDCPTVGVTGGWTQGGGGHGPGVSKFGLGADQALEWEVVTGTGEVLVASRHQNQDMYWALSGGGGGTYGVVSSLTAKVYPDLSSSAASLSFSSTGISKDLFWNAIHTWQATLISIIQSGCFAIWEISQDGFSLVPMNCPGLNRNDTMKLLHPIRTIEFSNFYDSYKAYNMRFPKNVSTTQLGSRLIPRDVLIHNNTELTDALRKGVDRGAYVVATAVDASLGNNTDYGSVNPNRRQAAFSAIFATVYNQTDYDVNIALANEMTQELLPMLEALTPGGSAYMNECDFQQPDFQDTLYGINYERLLSIKDKYDPDQIFYAITAVGSERWYQDQRRGGRLCRA